MRRPGGMLMALLLLAGCSTGVEESDAPQVRREMADMKATVVDGVDEVVPHLTRALGADLVSASGQWNTLSDAKTDRQDASFLAEAVLSPAPGSDPPLILEATAALAELDLVVEPEISPTGTARAAPEPGGRDVVVRLEETLNDPEPSLRVLVVPRGGRIDLPDSILRDLRRDDPEPLQPDTVPTVAPREHGDTFVSPAADRLLPLVLETLGGEPAYAFAAVLSCDGQSAGATGVVVRVDDAPERDEEAAHRTLSRGLARTGYRPEDDAFAAPLTDGTRRLRLDANELSGEEPGYLVSVQESCDGDPGGGGLSELAQRPVDVSGW